MHITKPRTLGLLSLSVILLAIAALPTTRAQTSVSIRVSIAARRLTVHGLPGPSSYPVTLGVRTSEGDKEREGDQRTPRGRYTIASLQPRHPRFHRFALLAYPNVDDAARGLAAGRIDADIAAQIRRAIERGRTPPQRTALGGQIGIHGLGTWDWAGAVVGAGDYTDGCIALRDADIDALWPALQRGTVVHIAL